MSINPKLLDILCCPVTHSPLRQLDHKHLSQLNQAIANNEVKSVEHIALNQALSDALITQDGKLIYPVIDGIPHLLPENAIATLQLKDF